MTTIIPFNPVLSLNQAPFTFQATLDGQLYACVVTWSPYGQRWYVEIRDQTGDLIVRLPLVGSSSGKLLASLSWSVGTGNGGVVTAITQQPHGFRLGHVVVLNFTQTLPVEYNALTPCEVVDPKTFEYPLAADPGSLISPGQYSYDINLVQGYFLSTMVWRIQSGNIEINP